MTLADIIELEQMAKGYQRLYEDTGLCGFTASLNGKPEVQLTPKEFFNTFEDIGYEYKGDGSHYTVRTEMHDVVFMALLNGTFVKEVQA